MIVVTGTCLNELYVRYSLASSCF